MKKNILIFFLSAVMVTGILAGCSKLDKSKEKKIEQIIEKDSDGDGVPDSIDEEPNTPKGVKVDSKGRALDSDGDGVADYMDEEPNTPKGVKVDLKGRALDSDGDGVADYMDEEPNTPQGVKVDSKGRALDSDGDGVADYMDEEPNTPKGVKVDIKGRALDSDYDGIPDYLDEEPYKPLKKTIEEKGSQKLIILDNITKNSDKLSEEMLRTLDKVAKLLGEDKKLKIKITGHTCSLGTEKYNMNLSKRRAKAAERYILSKKVKEKNIIMEWKGESMPSFSNDTEENRSKNRRVEILFYEDEAKLNVKK